MGGDETLTAVSLSNQKFSLDIFWNEILAVGFTC